MHSLSCLVVAGLFAVACGDNYELTGADGGPKRPQCDDAIDNDGDGDRDFPDDLGCDSASDDSEDSPAKPSCSDNRDNDGDGKKDYPNDPGCQLPQSDDEADNCPSGPGCPQCANGRDDDFNGKIDYPDDTGCESAADTTEFINDPDACGANMQIKLLPPTGMDMGTFDTSMSLSNLITPCGGGAGAPAYAYVLSLGEPKIVVASTDNPGTTADTVLDLRRSMCSDPSAHIACHDDVGAGNFRSQITASLQPGIYYLIVEGHDTTVTGDYQLTVQQFAGEGASCTMQSDCGPGLVCRVPAGGTDMICTQPVCNDGLDDDADGKIDYPDDPGCVGPTDATENDDCPAGPNCPDCGDGVDNDLDGQTDYPNDTSCAAASSASEACQGEVDPILAITSGTLMDNLAGAADNHDPSCGSNGGADKLFTLDLPAMSTVTVSTIGSSFDTLLSLLNSTCAEPSIACDDDSGGSATSLITRTNLAAGLYVLAVDAYSAFTTPGPFNVNVSGTIAAGGSCEGVLFQAGAIACGAGFSCDGPVGAKTCTTQCIDGIDNNGDGRIDYPADPGCSSPGDSIENTVCPGPTCPACADGVDNDLDGQTDYPGDPSCLAASGTSESCVTSESIGAITTAVTTGTTVGAVNDFDPTCNSTAGLAPDVIYRIDVPAMATLTFNVTNTPFFDSVLTLQSSSCTGSLVCSDPQLATIPNLAAGTYYVSIEGYFTASSAFTLTTGGQVVTGESCEGALFQSGAFTCLPGFACDGPAGARTCRNAQCSDSLDNNLDGRIDYPADPGCSSPGDNTETTVCPGPMCPVCADGVDNDGDGQTDYPSDTSCAAASSASEACQGEQDPILAITSGTTASTLVGTSDDHDPSCGSTGGPDRLFTLDLPALSTLTIDTEGSAISDTVLSLLDATCAEPSIACDDDSGTGLLSVITRTNVPAGLYLVAVDAYSSFTTLDTFTLHVSGTAVPGAACTSPLFASGALSCATGQTCTAGVCQ